MKFLIISHTPHVINEGKIYAYAPYVREMNLWLKHVNEVEIIAPIHQRDLNKIDMAYQRNDITLNTIPSISFISIKESIKSLFKLPLIFFKIFKGCQKANHIHLRCPGNIGLLGVIVQICFPRKIKTAKYAGNWDPKAKQPFSYKFQKWVLKDTFLTKKMSVLVYGKWKNQSKNIKPFFTASYHNSEAEPIVKRNYNGVLNFVFLGGLVKGKRPLFSIQIINELNRLGKGVKMDVYGEGSLKPQLIKFIQDNNLEDIVRLHGNQKKEIVKQALKKAHFLMLPSKSEGWPKAIAESMFFGVIPIATEVSCIPFMLDYGKRGVLISVNLNEAVNEILKYLKFEDLENLSFRASRWSQNYTLDLFESEIQKLLIR